MGSFNVSCFLSSLSISPAEKVSLFPIVKANKTNNIYSYDTQNFYIPYLLPIEGTYDDYGNLADIVSNKNTRLLEKYFGLPIQEISDLITCGRKNYWDDFSNIYEVFCEEKETFSLKYPEFLEHFKFQYLEKSKCWVFPDNIDNKKNHTLEIIENPQTNIFKIVIDMTLSAYVAEYQIVSKITELISTNFNYYLGAKEKNFKKIAIFSSLIPAYAKQELCNFFYKNKNNLEWNYFEEKLNTIFENFIITSQKRYELGISFLKLKHYEIARLASNPHSLAILNLYIEHFKQLTKEEQEEEKNKENLFAEFSLDVQNFYDFLNEHLNGFSEIYQIPFSKGQLNKEIIKFYYFLRHMNELNKVFLPTFIGCQCGNLDLENDFFNICKKNIKKKKAQYC